MLTPIDGYEYIPPMDELLLTRDANPGVRRRRECRGSVPLPSLFKVDKNESMLFKVQPL